ncbi:unnamed protein product [Lactuca saligna]|uniref:Uncharacterized protein n=1 Tax=Lactuca saligna TaxID=75948 RepID=A0AA35YRT9_LACSI|nr:unnamed protein product [Lactuca saligna]
MLKKVDSSNSFLQAYLKTINPSVEIGILLSRSEEDPSKHSICSKKVEESPTKPIQEKKKTKTPKRKPTDEVIVSKPEATTGATQTDEPSKEVVPSKTGVFKRLKKIAHRSRSSSDRSPSFSPSMDRKPHVTRKGVVIREIPVPISPFSKKHKAEDMAKQISMK